MTLLALLELGEFILPELGNELPAVTLSDLLVSDEYILLRIYLDPSLGDSLLRLSLL